MRSLSAPWLTVILLAAGLVACVDPFAPRLRSSLDIVVVEATLTDLPEAQVITLHRSVSDPFTGLPGVQLLTRAAVTVVVDSQRVINTHETTGGVYQLPSDFRGQVGHAYQLQFTLSDGAHYESSQQVMPPPLPIGRVTARFNATSLPPAQLNGFTAAHDLYVDTQDPANQANYYRWDWKLWERADWCRTCVQGRYSINNVLTLTSANGLAYFQTGDLPFENCFYPPGNGQSARYFVYDYPCRTRCWAIVSSHQLNLFADTYANGGLIADRKVAQIPFYQRSPCLAEVRQSALTPSAYRFYKLLQDQTQNNGGVADAPPTASVGNVTNRADAREAVVGFFTASAVSTLRYWLDRKDTDGVPPGLFEALNGRSPTPEPAPPSSPAFAIVITIPDKPPYTAVCLPSNGQTPAQPVGWRD